MKQFNVIIWDINRDTLESYDVLPYFRNAYIECKKKDRPSTLEEWKEFIERRGRYQFWARCEYEILISPWPTNNKQFKIDVWQQIKNNIDIVAEILANEYGNRKQRKSSKPL